MIADKTGGPAFPSPGIGTRQDETMYQRDGMTLWDWYAGQSLCGLCADESMGVCNSGQVAAYAGDYADAMLAERKKRGIV